MIRGIWGEERERLRPVNRGDAEAAEMRKEFFYFLHLEDQAQKVSALSASLR